MSISRASLYRSFKAPNGSTTSGIATYIQQRRLEAAHALISEEGGKLRMAEIAYQYGFRTQEFRCKRRTPSAEPPDHGLFAVSQNTVAFFQRLERHSPLLDGPRAWHDFSDGG